MTLIECDGCPYKSHDPAEFHVLNTPNSVDEIAGIRQSWDLGDECYNEVLDDIAGCIAEMRDKFAPVEGKPHE